MSISVGVDGFGRMDRAVVRPSAGGPVRFEIAVVGDLGAWEEQQPGPPAPSGIVGLVASSSSGGPGVALAPGESGS